MTTFEELKRRGLLAQLTDEKEIEELKNSWSFRIGRIITALPGKIRKRFF